MKLTTGIVALALTAGTAWAQNSATTPNTKSATPQQTASGDAREAFGRGSGQAVGGHKCKQRRSPR